MTLEEDRNAVLCHHLLDREFPAWASCAEFPGALLVVAAPFKQPGIFDATPSRPLDMVGKDEFVPGITLAECFFEPQVLGFTKGNPPRVPCFSATFPRDVIHGDRRMPVWINHHE